MDLRRTFNTDENNYDKSRPDYPKKLFKNIFDYVNLLENSNVIEIGIGTVQATLPFINKCCNVSAVEFGDKLARYCAQKFSHFDNFDIINSDFIEAKLPEKSFDPIYSTTYFHWIPKVSGYTKIKSLLKSGGAIALFWNHLFVSNTNDKTNLASMTVYKNTVRMIKHLLILI